MNNSAGLSEFEKSVKNKFNVYNSLFLSLPFRKVSNIGMLIPLMQQVCNEGLEAGEDPSEIMDSFFTRHTRITSEKEKIDFMFRVVQYIERQIVLYDSVEDAAFNNLLKFGDYIPLKDYIYLTEGKKEVVDKLSKFSTRIVFTAHPTQFYSAPVLEIISKLREFINENNINEIDLRLKQLGLTSLINSEKPTPFEEAKNIIYFLKTVYYDAVGSLYSEIKKTVKDKNFSNTNLVQLGFWPGGDRDGNPFVKAETTINVANELRMTLMKCYYKDLSILKEKLTFREIEDIIETLHKSIYEAMFNSSRYLSFGEIIEPLKNTKDLLIDKYNSLYLSDLEDLIDKVKIFKTHFATLDIRQNHSIHKKVICKILINEGLIKNNLEEIPEAELVEILLHKNIKLNPESFEDELLKDTVETISILENIQKKNGEEGCNRYIISNSEDLFSVLFVYALFKWNGYIVKKLPFDIIPLFESMEGMKNAEKIMRALFEIPEYRKHIVYRNNTQTIMLGFSDGTKDGGYLKANWSIFKTKETLSELCKEYGVDVIFFDGRGGPPARGGGKTHKFYVAQSNKIANNAIQLTIQGQTITSKYGTKEHFIHNCEQLLTSGLTNSINDKDKIISDDLRKTIDELSEISFNKYTKLKNHKMFVPYLENKSTLKYYSKTNIGSRPSKRVSSKKLDLNDLRAIPFVGSWSQLKQNVPGYYGIGTALKTFVDNGKLDELKKIFNDVAIFRALILNSMMSLSKCNFELTRYISKDKKYNEFWNLLYEEYKLSKEMTLLISGFDILMEEEPISRNSIMIREQIVLPLLVIQQAALQKIEQSCENKELYEKIVKRSLYGNINASRNSA
ncbi:MAG: phosphoenolpyruvate carboxylase [Melioribacteraceae bacterium]|nr:phosphoenolpyruvate carboxylase [Melioribacteraceae bacterium]